MERHVTDALVVERLEITRGNQKVLRGVDLTVKAGEIVALMGLSGAGKTTILRAVAALQPISAGSIRLGDVVLQPGPLQPQSRLGGLRSKVGMVFQEHALFEHLTVMDNVTLAPIHARRWTRERATKPLTSCSSHSAWPSVPTHFRDSCRADRLNA
jgi:ABC-type polar amino acid transport system, ATPase component